MSSGDRRGRDAGVRFLVAAFVLASLPLIIPIGTVSLGEGLTSVDKYYVLLDSMSAEAMLRFPEAMFRLNKEEASAERDSFFTDTRDYLEGEGIFLPKDFILTAFDPLTAMEHGEGEPPAVFFDDPDEGFTYQYAGIGWNTGTVGLLIQFVVSVRGTREELAGTVNVPGGGDIAVRTSLQVLTSIPEPLLNALPEIMDEVNENETERNAFVNDPRLYLAERGIALEKNEYRISAFDFEADGLGAWYHVQGDIANRTREGMGFFFNNVGLFIQQGG